jgi:hypothetical protein
LQLEDGGGEKGELEEKGTWVKVSEEYEGEHMVRMSD